MAVRGSDPRTRLDGREEPAATGIVAALPEEVEPILDRLGPPVPSVRAPDAGTDLRDVRTGRLSGLPVAVAVTGDGRRNAVRGAASFLDSRPLARLLVVGVAGGLVPGLDRGTILAGRAVWRPEAPSLRPPGPLLERATAAVGLPSGVVATVDRLLDSPAAKKAVLERLVREDLAPDRAVADLESAFYAAAAAERRIPWLVLRAVSDEASEALPSFLNRCRDEGGAVSRSRVARHLLLHPARLPEVLRLRSVVERCAESLADSVEALLGCLNRSGTRDGR